MGVNIFESNIQLCDGAVFANLGETLVGSSNGRLDYDGGGVVGHCWCLDDRGGGVSVGEGQWVRDRGRKVPGGRHRRHREQAGNLQQHEPLFKYHLKKWEIVSSKVQLSKQWQ